MKKLVPFVFFIAVLLLSCSQKNNQQNNEPVVDPVYVNTIMGYFPSEFAENGTTTIEMQFFEPYVQNDRLYFICFGSPVKSGNLKPGFEFRLSEDHEIVSVYQGRQTEYVNSADFVITAGFAQKGAITITNVFFDEEAMEAWAETVTLADFNEEPREPDVSEMWGRELFESISDQ
jgi:hypothetical protein